MKKLYEKSALIFSFAWIAIYCVLQSLAYPLNEIIGIEYAASAVFCFLQATALFMFIKKNGLLSYYGICKTYVPAPQVPLLHSAACPDDKKLLERSRREFSPGGYGLLYRLYAVRRFLWRK